MTDGQMPKIENLELNRETIADLAEAQAEQAKGGESGRACGEEIPQTRALRIGAAELRVLRYGSKTGGVGDG
jgi:hypothetical protein